MERVVIIVPSQGHNTDSFLSVARMLKARLYPHATIVKTKVFKTKSPGGGETSSASFTKLDGAPYSWSAKPHLTRVLTISHAMLAGQNLTYGDQEFADGSGQPWGSQSELGALSPEGQTFWKTVGDSIRPHGKIIMLGCLMAAHPYAESVAKAAHRRVYASTDFFGAGDAHTAFKYVAAIEAGHVLKPLKAFAP